MHSYKLILCPTDLSPDSDDALGYAAALAVANDATLLVVYHRGDSADLAWSNAEGLFEESIGLHVAPALADALRWKGIVVTSPTAAESIARVAAELHVDLIVMRSRRRPFGATLLGSTAEAVSRFAPCSVLVTHPDEGTSRGVDARMERILVAYDFWDDSEIALQHAVRLAADHGATIHLLHALSSSHLDTSEVSWKPLGAGVHLHRTEGRLWTAVPQSTPLGVTVVPHVVIGQPYREILSFAEAHSIDLICMGARGRDFSARSLFGSNSDRVLRQAPCPVLVGRPLRPACVSSSANPSAANRIEPLASPALV